MRETWEDIYHRHRQQLFTYALAITSCPERAEDAIQEVFLRLYRRDRAPASPTAYVFRAVRNAALNQSRDRRPAAQELPSYIFENGAGPELEATRKEFRNAVAGALLTLSADQREAVVLRIYGQLSFREISEVLSVPLGTVTSRYRRALEELSQRLRPFDERP